MEIDSEPLIEPLPAMEEDETEKIDEVIENREELGKTPDLDYWMFEKYEILLLVLETEVNDENTDTANIPDDTEGQVEEKLHRFPLGRVKNIMKMDPDVKLVSQETVFLVTRAIELFVESLAIESYSYTANAKKKTISKQDVEKAIDAVDALAFLDGAMDDWMKWMLWR